MDIKAYQSKVIKKIDQANLSFKKRSSFTNVINGLSGTIKYKDIKRLQNMSQVKSVHIANKYEPNRVSEVSNESKQQQDLQRYSVLGDNLIIAIIDDGVDYRFEEFAGNGTTKPINSRDLTETEGYTSKVIGGYNWADQNNNIIGTAGGHGTHVAAIAAGKENINYPEYGMGVAPNALILAEKVFSNDPEVNFAMSDDIIAGIDHAITYHADVINISISNPAGYISTNQPELQAVQRAVGAGIVVSISAGNYSNTIYPDKPEWNDYSTIGTPAVWPAAFTVAASGQSELDGDLRIADFSSRGPNVDISLKPDITAPGTDIIKPTVYDSVEPYRSYSGTSMAAPYAAGASVLVKEALIKQGVAHPTVTQIKAALANTAEIIKQENGLPYLPNAQGAGSIQIEQAIHTPGIVTSENEETSVSLREISSRLISFKLQVSNLTNKGLTYTVSNNGVFTEGLTNGELNTSLVEGAVTSTDLPNNQVSLSAHETKTFEVRVVLPESLMSGRYIGAWIDLNANNLPSLSIPFFGYLGDWNAIPMINEVAKFNELDNHLNSIVPTAIYDSSGYLPNGYDYSYNTIDPNKAAFSPITQLGVLFNYQLLRFAKKQVFQIIGQDGHVWVEHKFDNVLKGLENSYNWYWNNALPMLWDGTYYNSQTGKQELVPEGSYTLRIKAISQLGDENNANEWQSNDEIPSELMPAFRLKFEGYTEDNVPLILGKTIELFSFDQGVLRTSLDQLEWPVFATNNNRITWSVDPNSQQPSYYEYTVNWGLDALDFTNAISESLDGESHSITFDPLQFNSGQRFGTLFIHAYDENEHLMGSLFYPIRVDNTKPILDLYGLPISSFQVLNRSQVELNNLQIVDMESDVKFRINGQPFGADPLLGYNSFYYGSIRLVSGIFELAQGRQTTVFETIDEAGNVSRLDRTVLVDTSSPIISMGSAEAHSTEATKFRLSGTVSDEISLQEILVNGNLIYLDNQGFNFGKRSEQIIEQNINLSMGQNNIKVEAYDKAGNHAEQNIEINRVHPSTSDRDDTLNDQPQSGGEAPTVVQTTKLDQQLELKSDGIEILNILQRSIVQDKGREVVHITISQSDLKKNVDSVIASSASGADRMKMIFHLEDIDKPIEMQLPAEILNYAVTNVAEFSIQVQLKNMSYELPLKVLNILNLAKQLDVSIRDLNIIIRMGEVGDDLAQEAKVLLQTANVMSLGPIVDFSVIAQSNSKELTIESFGNEYVSRSIFLPTSVQSSKATAVMIDLKANQSLFVPAIFKPLSDGRTEVIMKRNGNSLYGVVTQDKLFSDIKGHWAQQDIELLASKRIVFGEKSNVFAPNRNVTRAEFATLISRALSLNHDGGMNRFHDVKETDWFNKDVYSVAAAKLIFGFDGDTFRPNESITREAMSVIVARALQFAASSSVVATIDSSTDLSRFNDANQISSWAKGGVSLLLKNHVIEGITETTFAPIRPVSRAEVTVVLKRLLVTIGFIN